MKGFRVLRETVCQRPLHVVPDQFIRIELRRIRRKWIHVHPWMLLKENPDDARSMRFSSIPE